MKKQKKLDKKQRNRKRNKKKRRKQRKPRQTNTQPHNQQIAANDLSLNLGRPSTICMVAAKPSARRNEVSLSSSYRSCECVDMARPRVHVRSNSQWRPETKINDRKHTRREKARKWFNFTILNVAHTGSKTHAEDSTHSNRHSHE